MSLLFRRTVRPHLGGIDYSWVPHLVWASRSAVDTVVTDAVPPGLREKGQPMRPIPGRDAVEELPGAGVYYVDLAVEAAGGPELCAIGRHLQHIRVSADRDRPLGDNAAGRKRDDRNAAL